ncbi:hypothetical protein JAAARDRAFT_188434 [Jaapia argillacea MUCL 33604]|uniref:Uncharacterized protein n=1 Tax=Jaapia argillacea MUCL 33604 TaxID=933084 RepID=A0A067QG60_9AGAM|nr:hypothetical protein JAAARDRAFT_188434 [Jaapia argillacea MUCL 33604]
MQASGYDRFCVSWLFGVGKNSFKYHVVRLFHLFLQPPTFPTDMSTSVGDAAVDNAAPLPGTKPKGKRGAPAKTVGTKHAFLQRRIPEWLLVRNRKVTTTMEQFYTKVTKLWFHKYGYDMEFGDDLAVDVPDPELSVLDGPEPPCSLDPVEKREKVKDHRGRISQWYRNKFTKVSKTNSNQSVIDLINSALGGDRLSSAPRKRQATQMFLRLYKPQIIPVYNIAWQKELARAQMSPQDMLANQSPEVRAYVDAAVEGHHRKAIEESEKEAAEDSYRRADDSPEAYERALLHSGDYIAPLASSIGDNTGTAVVVLLVGPISREGGNVGVRV